MSSLVLEIRKHRRSRLPFLVLGLAALQALWLGALVAASASRSSEGIRTLQTSALYDYLNLQTVLIGPTIAFLATRVVGVDRDGRMGQLFRALGQSAGRQFLVKLTLLTGLGFLISMTMFFTGATIGYRAGLLDSPSYGSTFWLVAALAFTSTLAVSATQLGVAHLLDHAAGTVVIGVLGSLVASFLPYLHLAHLGWVLPWGLLAAGSPYPLITPENAIGADFTLVPDPSRSVVVTGIVALAWVGLSAWLVIVKEENS